MHLARRAVDLEPDTWTYRDTHAWALYANGLFDEAVAESQRSLELGRLHDVENLERIVEANERLEQLVRDALEASPEDPLSDDSD